ncbi:hypothetical protein U0070_006386, partial [Myodes glareolus]
MNSEQKRNYSEVTEFILLGFRTPPKFQVFLFLVFLMIYMVTVVGNVSMIMIIKMDSRLQTPMSKTFSTCGSHIAVVSLFYGTVFFMYAQPGSISSPKQSKIVAVFYTLIIPMLNPLIYSLRNRDVKDVVKKVL